MNALIELDVAVFHRINSFSHPLIDPLMYFISILGQYGFIFFLICLVVYLTKGQKGKEAAFLCFVTMLLSDQVIGQILKILWNRPRPFMYLEGIKVLGHKWANSSFPSGHADTVFAATVILSFFYPRLTWSLYIFCVLTCVSRIYCGMHHPIDVIAGAGVGLITGYCMLFAWKRKQVRIDWLLPLFVFSSTAAFLNVFLHKPQLLCLGIGATCAIISGFILSLVKSRMQAAGK